ncbi:MAG: hypothetical protein LW712_16760 [Burkholderiaceae bacterium]|nr:hypothetical protein [Burkholderiaceae bacterium]
MGGLAWGLLLAACSPAHDWREVRSADGAVQALFPCRPQLHERRRALAGTTVKLSLQACDSGGQTWGLASADLLDPARLAPALDELAAAAGANLAASPRTLPLQVPGATPHPGSRRVALEGQRPDGQGAQMRVALFTHGTRVYQATALGARLPEELVDTYLGSLRVQP